MELEMPISLGISSHISGFCLVPMVFIRGGNLCLCVRFGSY
jgi:hypothetical protein